MEDIAESYPGLMLFCNFTDAASSQAKMLFCNFTDKAESDYNVTLKANFVKTIPDEFPYIQFKCNFVNHGYFPSFKRGQVTRDELSATFGTNAYLLCPDIDLGYPIPHEDLIRVSNFRWFANTPIGCTIQLKNFDGKYSDPDNEILGNLITEEIWSPERNTRKFFALEFMSICGKATKCILFPRMVIKEVTGTDILNIVLIDEISEYLYRDPECPSYCMEEALIRIDSTHYMSYTLTNFYYDRNKNSEFLINYEQQLGGFSADPDTFIVTLTREVTNDQIPVTLRNPMTVKEIINGEKGLLKKVIDAQVECPKDYIDVQMNFKDFPVYSTIQTQDSNVITIMKRNLLDSIPADFLIMPILDHQPELNRNLEALLLLNKKFTLLIQDCVLNDELPEPAFTLTPELMRETPVPNRVGTNKINSQNIIKEIELGNFYTLQLTSNQEQSQQVDQSTAPSPVISPPPSPNIVNIVAVRMRPKVDIPNGTIADFTGFVIEGSGEFISKDWYEKYKSAFQNPAFYTILWDEIIRGA